MAYLITQLLVPLLATAVFAALAGWCYYAMRARSKDEAQERERARLLNELLGVASPTRRLGEAPLELEAQRRRADLESARVAELERALASARARADDAAEQKMQVESELARLREVSSIPTPVALTAPTAPAADETESLRQAWRLRYFEQRVRYLEAEREAAAELPAPAQQTEILEPMVEVSQEFAEEPRLADDLASLWRARYYESRTRFLERAAREAARADEASASSPDADAAQPLLDVGRTADEENMLQWRLRYLTQRVAHLQQAALAVHPTPVDSFEAGIEHDADWETDAKRLKWRTRYLEARVRHLEGRVTPVATPVGSKIEMAVAPVVEASIEVAPVDEIEEYDAEARVVAPIAPMSIADRPPALPAARNGAPDDLRLIEGVNPLQQSTLNSLGIYHFDQIAAWTPSNIAWVDQYLRLRGRILDEEWVEQAHDLARDGPQAARREHEPEFA